MKLDLEKIQQINLFEKVTKSLVKDCFINNDLYLFVVEPGNASKAIGKQGINIRKMAKLLRKKIKVVEYTENLENFLTSLIFPLKMKEIVINESIEVSADTKTKGLLIGRNRKNLTFYNEILKKYFNKELKIKNG